MPSSTAGSTLRSEQMNQSLTPNQLVSAYPRLYHMAESDTWPRIRRHGLLSTTALLDRSDLKGKARYNIESVRRRQSVTIKCKGLGLVTIRDQKPINDATLSNCLVGMAPSAWYRLLNKQVFFWLSRDRLTRLLNAKAYRDRTHCVLTIDTGKMVANYAHVIRLSPINSGAAIMQAATRGRKTFLPITKCCA